MAREKIKSDWIEFFKDSYRKWVSDYQAYAKLRGYKTFNDGPYHRRGFLECWAQPGFFRFWQVWNPGIAYFSYRCYLMLGGRKHWVIPTIGAFVINGFIHNLVMALFYQTWSWTLIVTFLCFGLLTVISRKLAGMLRQDRWPVPFNIMVNIGSVVLSFDIGFQLN